MTIWIDFLTSAATEWLELIKEEEKNIFSKKIEITTELSDTHQFIILAGELCNTVQDAFLIAVEQQARERLQRLSALKRITPVDISQLSIKVCR
jgi:glucose-6-phosphate isomerase